jgi:acyl-CoA thioesterase FadM
MSALITHGNSVNADSLASLLGPNVPERPLLSFDSSLRRCTEYRARAGGNDLKRLSTLWKSGSHIFERTIRTEDTNYAGYLFGGELLHFAQLAATRYLVSAVPLIAAEHVQMHALNLAFRGPIFPDERIRAYVNRSTYSEGRLGVSIDIVCADAEENNIRSTARGEAVLSLESDRVNMPTCPSLENEIMAYQRSYPVITLDGRDNYALRRGQFLAVLDLLTCQLGRDSSEKNILNSPYIATKKFGCVWSSKVTVGKLDDCADVSLDSQVIQLQEPGHREVKIRVVAAESDTCIATVRAETVDLKVYKKSQA